MNRVLREACKPFKFTASSRSAFPCQRCGASDYPKTRARRSKGEILKRGRTPEVDPNIILHVAKRNVNLGGIWDEFGRNLFIMSGKSEARFFSYMIILTRSSLFYVGLYHKKLSCFLRRQISRRPLPWSRRFLSSSLIISLALRKVLAGDSLSPELWSEFCLSDLIFLWARRWKRWS